MWGKAFSVGGSRGTKSAWESSQPERRNPTGIWLDSRGTKSAWETAQPERRNPGAIWLDPTYRDMAMRTLRNMKMSSNFAPNRKSPYFAQNASSTPRDSAPRSEATSVPSAPSVRKQHHGEGASSNKGRHQRSTKSQPPNVYAESRTEQQADDHNSFKRRLFWRAKKYSQPESSRATVPAPTEHWARPTPSPPDADADGDHQSLTDHVRVLLAKDDKAAKVSLLTELRHIAEAAKAERRSRFRALQRIVHPDKWPPALQSGATKLFQLVQEHSAAVDGVVPARISAWD